MANLSFSITTTAGTVTHNGPNISEADMIRFRDFIWVAYPQLDVNGDPKPRNTANEVLAFKAWARAMWQGTKANVLRFEDDIRVTAAKAAVVEIVES